VENARAVRKQARLTAISICSPGRKIEAWIAVAPRVRADADQAAARAPAAAWIDSRVEQTVAAIAN